MIKNINKKEGNDSDWKKDFCLNCSKLCDHEDEDSHQGHCILYLNNDDIYKDNRNDIDYNFNLNKIYENLKKEQNKILKHGNKKFISFYGNLLFYLYEIIINDNSIEELNISIININNAYINEIQNESFCQDLKSYFLFYVRKICNLSYLKLKKIEKIITDIEFQNDEVFSDIKDNDDEQNVNNIEHGIKINNTNIYFDKMDEEGKKKYFLKLGLDIKYKYGKNDCISELYSKAKEENVDISQFKDFIMKKLEISNN